MMQTSQRLQSYFLDHQNDFILLLKSLVEQETPSDNPLKFEEIFEIINRNFEKLGFQTEFIPGVHSAGQLLFKPNGFNSNNPSQLIIGHCDTVWEMGTLIEMPFTAQANKAMGPGIFDMKAGICMMIYAMKAIREFGLTPDVQPLFLITSDEETGSRDSKEMIIEMAKQSERTFVLEPALGPDGKIKTARKGVGQFEIDIKGKPSHAGLDPEKGVSAILALSEVVQQLVKLNEPDKGINVNVGTIEGGERANVVAAKSKAVIDVRVPTWEAGELIKEKIQNLKSEQEGIKIDVLGGFGRPPFEKSEAGQRLWVVVKSLGSKLGLKLEEATSGGGSDGNFTNLHSPTIDGLGAVGEGAHAYNEKIFIEETLNRGALLALLILHPSLMCD
ncbi:MAG: M20 family metallopeptidase [Balneolaceae bacterium]